MSGSWRLLSSALLRPVCFLLFGLCGLVQAQASSQAGVPQTLAQLQQQLAGQPAEVITAQANPQLFEFSHLLLSLFRSDTQVLARQFELGLSPGEVGWQLLLTPKQPPLNQIFLSLELAGAQSLDRLTIRDRQGDTTRLTFTPVLPNPVELSDVELRRFAP